MFPDSISLSRSIARLTQTDRIRLVRGMLLALAASPGTRNELFETTRKRAHSETNIENCTIKYAVKGHTMCLNGFLAVTQISESTLRRHAASVSSSSEFELYDTKKYLGRKGKFSLQTTIAAAFLSRYSELHSLPCPRGRGSTEEESVRFLPSGMLRKEVYGAYKLAWKELSDAVVEDKDNLISPSEPLPSGNFTRSGQRIFKLFVFIREYLTSATSAQALKII